MVTRSPEAIFSTGFSAASRKPQCTVSGLDFRRCVRADVDGCATEMFMGLLLALRMSQSRGGSTARNDPRLHGEAVLRDLAGAGEPDPILVLVLGAMLDRLAQRAQAERLADDEPVQRQGAHHGLFLGRLQQLLE